MKRPARKVAEMFVSGQVAIMAKHGTAPRGTKVAQAIQAAERSIGARITAIKARQGLS